MQIINVKLSPGATLPTKNNPEDAGYDLYALNTLSILPGKRVLVKTGIVLDLPIGFEAQIRPRSGLALKRGITVLNTPGTVDAGYRGDVGVILMNHSEDEFLVVQGDRIAQMVIQRVEPTMLVEAATVSETPRGENGFGSSGK